MTTHKFAKLLLALGDVPIVIPRVLQYDEDADGNIGEAPVVSYCKRESDGAVVALLTHEHKESK